MKPGDIWEGIGVLIAAYFTGTAIRQSEGTAAEAPADMAIGLLVITAVLLLIGREARGHE